MPWGCGHIYDETAGEIAVYVRNDSISLVDPDGRSFLAFIGDTNNFADFDADIEMTLGDKIVKINYPCYIFIPKNVMHCPLDIKRVGKPLIFVDARITKEASVRPAKTAKIKPIKYIAKNNK